eukprot:1678164-Pyramimonas_sp.AAC.1
MAFDGAVRSPYVLELTGGIALWHTAHRGPTQASRAPRTGLLTGSLAQLLDARGAPPPRCDDRQSRAGHCGFRRADIPI